MIERAFIWLVAAFILIVGPFVIALGRWRKG